VPAGDRLTDYQREVLRPPPLPPCPARRHQGASPHRYASRGQSAVL